jgi:hypothetical protein
MSSNTAGFATLTGSPRVVNIPALGTSPVQVSFVLDTGVVVPSQSIVRARILNLSSTADVAFTVGSSASAYQVTTGATPTVTTAPVVSSVPGDLSATDGVRVFAGSFIELNISPNQSLWVVASAADTPVQVVYFAQNG